MDQTNFLKQVGGLKGQGDGFRLDRLVDLHDFYLQSDGSNLTTTLTTNPGFVVVETNAIALRWNAGVVVAAGFNLTVPADYDAQADELRFLGIAQMGGATDTPALNMNAWFKRSGSALSAALGPVASTTPSAGLSPLTATQSPALALSATSKTFLIDFSKNKLRGEDQLFFTLFPGAHATDTVNVYGLWLRYRSTLAAYDETKR